MKLTKKRVASEFARRSMVNFTQITQSTIQLTPFHKTYYKILNEFAHGNIKRLIISIPPQHGKSLGSTTLLPAYALGINPTLKIAIASYNLSLASKFNRRIQRLIDSETYKDIFPHTQLKKSASLHQNYVRNSDEFDIIGTGGGLLSVGREGSLTGNPVDMFILDDLYKDALEANSPLIRENTWEWYNAVVKTRLHNDSQELIVFTRWHEDDLIGRIEAHEQVVELTSPYQFTTTDKNGEFPDDCWYKLNFEAIKEGAATEIDPRTTGMPLWKERHSLKLLTDKRRLDSQLFETMYQGHPTAKEGLLYSVNFITYDSLPSEIVRYANYTDTADSGEDYLCSVCYVTDLKGVIYITDLVYSQLSMEHTENMVSEMLNENNTKIANIESNNGGRGFARSVQKMTTDCKIEWFHQSRNKEARILSNAPSVLRSIAMPRDWSQRWNTFYSHLTTYKRTYKANRWHDAADVITGIIEIEADNPARKTIKAVRFKA